MNNLMRLLAAMAVSGFVAAPVYAQSSASIEEVVVTARKKDESLTDVPIAISLTTGEEIQRNGYRDLQSIVGSIPAINLSKAGASAFINVRGVGSGENPGFEQSVGYAIDGVSVGRSRATRAGVLDLEQVEILKGPQTTYFGANTIAGVINVTTRGAELSGEVEGYAQTSYETETEEVVLEAAVNLPVSDSFALRLAARYTDSEGYLNDTGTGDKVPALEDGLYRISALWQAGDNFTARFKYNHVDLEANDGLDIQQINCEPLMPPTRGGPSSGNCVQADGEPVEGRLDYHRNTDLPGSRALDLDMAVLDLELAIGEYSLTSVTGWYEFNNDFVIDLDLTSVPSNTMPTIQSRFGVSQFDDAEHTSQEFRLASPLGGQYEWTIGLYYQEEDSVFSNVVSRGFRVPPMPPAPAVTMPGVTGAISSQTAETFSVFGTLLVQINDRMRVSFGLRHIEVDKAFKQPPLTLGRPQPNGVPDARSFVTILPYAFQYQNRSDDDLLPSVDIQYDLSDSANIYFAYKEGFKAGGYSLANPGTNTLTTPAGPGSTDYVQTFDPEGVNAFELGLKGVFLDGRVNVNAALFHSTFEDRQVSSLAEGAGLSQAVANAAESTSRGIEMDFTALLSDRLTLKGSFTYLDSEFDDFPNAPCYTGQTPGQGCVVIGMDSDDNDITAQDLGGHETTFAPDFSGSLTLIYEQPLGDYALTIEPNVFYSDGYALISDFNPLNVQDSFAKFNLRIGLAPGSGNWDLAFVGRNLNDEATTHFCQEALTQLSGRAVACSIDPPATYAFQGRINF
ncbi:MAG: TonB-dependent receptor [Pseudomonadales bacterium]